MGARWPSPGPSRPARPRASGWWCLPCWCSRDGSRRRMPARDCPGCCAPRRRSGWSATMSASPCAARGRIGMLPLGLVALPGALLWRAGRWVVRKGGVSGLAEVGYAALALAVPYALLAGALALASRSSLAAPSLLQAVVAGFLLALVAGGLGGA